ncbi:MAG: hypothetical protein WCH79_02320 [Planctomycetia bacterium]
MHTRHDVWSVGNRLRKEGLGRLDDHRCLVVPEIPAARHSVGSRGPKDWLKERGEKNRA